MRTKSISAFKHYFSLLAIASCLTVACSQHQTDYAALQTALEEIVQDKEARIGVTVIIDRQDTIGVNQLDPFPMLSVYKFPIALAVTAYCRDNGLGLDAPCLVTRSDLLRDTYSPMLDTYADIDTARISIRELLDYSLRQSDNNASDRLLKFLGGVSNVQVFLESLGHTDIRITSSEADMHQDPTLCYANSSTPQAMAALFSHFDQTCNDNLSEGIKQLMENCMTGTDRLAAPLRSDSIVLGHKTGTGFLLPDGRLMAVNDVGYVHLPDGRSYSIAVFIADSAYDMDDTSKIIADISETVYQFLKR